MKKLIILISVFLIASCGEEEKQISSEPKAVKTIEVSAKNNIKIRQLSGVVQTIDLSDLSFRVSGKVETVNFDLGSQVKKDDVLATLEQKDYVLAVNSAKADLQSARSDLKTKKQEFTRQKNLLKKNFVSKAAFEKSESAYQSSLADVAIFESSLEKSKNDLDRTILRAPFDGKIALRDVEPFTQITAGQTVFALQGDEGMEVEIAVPETLIREINYGDNALITFPALEGVKVKGVISEIAAKSEAGNSYPSTIRLLEENEDLRAGMTAEAQIYPKDSEELQSFSIPTSAIDLRFFDGKSGKLKEKAPIFLVGDDSKLKMIYVKIIDIKGNELVVGEGLKEGDKIVIAGVSFLTEGQEVKDWDPKYSIPATLNK